MTPLASFFVPEFIGVTNSDVFDFELPFYECDGYFDGERSLERHPTTHSDQGLLRGLDLVGRGSIPAFRGRFASQLVRR